jgi:pyrroloquinoline quinone (PQQ) biosynthesis protein C
MVRNRRKRERHEAALEEVRAEAAALANEARGVLTYEVMAEALGLSRAMVGYLLAPADEVAAGAG